MGDCGRKVGKDSTTIARAVYNANDDDKTCDDCNSLDGHTFDVEDISEFSEIFPYGQAEGDDLFRPNLHHRCRCLLILIETYWTSLGFFAQKPIFPEGSCGAVRSHDSYLLPPLKPDFSVRFQDFHSLCTAA